MCLLCRGGNLGVFFVVARGNWTLQDSVAAGRGRVSALRKCRGETRPGLPRGRAVLPGDHCSLDTLGCRRNSGVRDNSVDAGALAVRPSALPPCLSCALFAGGRRSRHTCSSRIAYRRGHSPLVRQEKVFSWSSFWLEKPIAVRHGQEERARSHLSGLLSFSGLYLPIRHTLVVTPGALERIVPLLPRASTAGDGLSCDL